MKSGNTSRHCTYTKSGDGVLDPTDENYTCQIRNSDPANCSADKLLQGEIEACLPDFPADRDPVEQAKIKYRAADRAYRKALRGCNTPQPVALCESFASDYDSARKARAAARVELRSAKLAFPVSTPESDLRARTIASIQAGPFDMGRYKTCAAGHIIKASGLPIPRTGEPELARKLWIAAYGEAEGNRLDFGRNWRWGWSDITAEEVIAHLNGAGPC